MVKAKDFWEYMCNVLDYRFFSGVPVVGFKPLYDNMNKEFMHYVPAVNEQIALSLSTGAYISGFKSAILVDANKINKLDLDINTILDVPILIIACSVSKPHIKNSLFMKELNDNLDVIKSVVYNISKNNVPSILFFKAGQII
jgi:sulfopyruvate decarboxylase TPP-binding subunit